MSRPMPKFGGASLSLPSLSMVSAPGVPGSSSSSSSAVTLFKQPAAAKKENVILFKGFIGARGFLTKKGFKGMRMDASWSKFILESLKMDDLELFEIACESVLLDLDCRVEGGNNGAPLSIGDQGIFGGNQFASQTDMLQKVERAHIARAGIFISDYEWSIIDGNLGRLGSYSTARFAHVYRGDTWASLAVADNAFLVANAMILRGVDPLLENADGKDLFDIVKQQYGVVTLRLRDMRLAKEAAAKQLVLPSVAKEMENREAAILETLTNMLTFCTSLKSYYIKRLSVIDSDVVENRRADRSGLPVDPWKRWNAGLREKTAVRIMECDELRAYIKEKLTLTEKKKADAASKVDYTKKLLMDAESLKQKTSGAIDEDSGDGDVEGAGALDEFSDSLTAPSAMAPWNDPKGLSSRTVSFMSAPLLTNGTPSDLDAAGPSMTSQDSWVSKSLERDSKSVRMPKTLSWCDSVLESSSRASSVNLQPTLGVLSRSSDSIVMYK